MTPETDAAPCPGMNRETGQLPWRGAPPSEGGQGDEWAPTSRSTCMTRTYHGIAYGARALRRRSVRSSRRSNDLPGRPGEPVTGRRGIGDHDVQRWEAKTR